ncbi:MAG: DEAD/DEAH box helicase [Desulfotignum sp.]|jgi:ATP-dependent RNA helicase DeaD|nr:DEAD/DEAH box helicase [Desulfotignum sp.]
MPQQNVPVTGFDEMDLDPAVFSCLEKVGYTTPTPIQRLTIPHLLANKDLLGQARTGTGKTAAFALPLLSRIRLDIRRPQVLVLTPTRELAIQVAAAFTTYGQNLKGLGVLSVYGGQGYGIQLSQLKKGVHVVVGTPGRLMDHMKRSTITFSDLFCRVLDEADEMLRMGFIEDVEWILDRTPKTVQTALFSATLPAPVKKIAARHLTAPQNIQVQPEGIETTAIRQQFWMAKGATKAHALVRILSAASFDGVIVFVKTKSSTLAVAKNLEASGFKAEALNGDMAQTAREQTVSRLKNGRIDILVATDVAARGLDVDRISHVINYDMPGQVDPYIHRIGRTGRAGRTGEAILFTGRNERWMVRKIEKATRQPITEMHLPSPRAVNKKRIADFHDSISKTLESRDLETFESLVASYAETNGVPMVKVAAALAGMAHGDTPLLLDAKKADPASPAKKQTENTVFDETSAASSTTIGRPRKPVPAGKQSAAGTASPTPLRPGMERYRIEAGESHGIKPKDIVGAIANEAGLESRHIKDISIHPQYSLVDLPEGMPGEIFRLLKRTWIRSRQMSISRCA